MLGRQPKPDDLLIPSREERKDVLEWVTPARRHRPVHHATLPRETLCAEVAKLKIGLGEGKVIALPRAANARDGGGASYDPSTVRRSSQHQTGFLAGWTGLEGGAARGIEGVSAGYRGVASAAEDGKAADTPPMHDTLDRSLDQSSDVEIALAQALAKAAAAGRYDVVIQLARRLNARPVRDPSRTRAEDDLAVAVRLAAQASEWAVVATLSRHLDALRREREGGGLKVIKGGSGASGSGKR